jgi:hypothetical protein
MKEYITAYIFFSCAEETSTADVSSCFMNKSMEGDGADGEWRRSKSFGPLHIIKVK